MVARGRNENQFHTARFRVEQRAHRAALLTVALLLAASTLRAGDIEFSPQTTQADFRRFSEIVSQGIYANPVEPARPTSLLGFDVGVAATAIQVDSSSAYWTRSVPRDFLRGNYLIVPRLVASKGLGFATVSASLAKVPDSDIRVIGGNVAIPIINGSLVSPSLSVRATYTQLQGVRQFSLKSYGAEAFLSKGFGPLTPYVGAGIVRSESHGRIEQNNSTLATFDEQFDKQRITAGLRISLLVPKIIIEMNQGQDRTYAAKISLGL